MQASTITWETAPIDTPMPGVTRRRVVGQQAMVSHFTLQQGVVVPMHQHANEQIGIVLSGCIRFEIADQPEGATREVTLTAGMAIHLPGNVPHGATAAETTVMMDVFSPPSEATGVDQSTTGRG